MKNEIFLLRMSLCLFTLSLIFPPFYVGPTQSPFEKYSLALLLVGWLGFIEMDFSWFANPLYVYAMLRLRKGKSALFPSVLSFLLALSFLVRGELVVIDSGWIKNPTAYGFGYFLWLMAITLVLFSSLNTYLRNESSLESKRLRAIVFVQHALLLLFTLIFCIHYFSGDSSHHNLLLARSEFLDENCKNANTLIYEVPKDFDGVFFATRSSARITSGLAKITEMENREGKELPYLRIERGVAEEEVADLKSQYRVETEILTKQLKPEMALYGEKVSVIDMRTGSVIATNTYFQSQVLASVDDERCGTPANSFLQRLFRPS